MIIEIDSQFNTTGVQRKKPSRFRGRAFSKDYFRAFFAFFLGAAFFFAGAFFFFAAMLLLRTSFKMFGVKEIQKVIFLSYLK